jgi:hypothetical protein
VTRLIWCHLLLLRPELNINLRPQFYKLTIKYLTLVSGTQKRASLLQPIDLFFLVLFLFTIKREIKKVQIILSKCWAPIPLSEICKKRVLTLLETLFFLRLELRINFKPQPFFTSFPMPYHQLPAAFVANDFLCDFLLAQGLTENTVTNDRAGCRTFTVLALDTWLTVDQPAGEIEVLAGHCIQRRYARLPAAALVLLLTMARDIPAEVGLFLMLVSQFNGCPATTGQLPPLAGAR